MVCLGLGIDDDAGREDLEESLDPPRLCTPGVVFDYAVTRSFAVTETIMVRIRDCFRIPITTPGKKLRKATWAIQAVYKTRVHCRNHIATKNTRSRKNRSHNCYKLKS